MDVTSKIKQILKQRGWSAYRLAKESGLSESTIANIIKRNAIEVTPKTRELIDCWSGLSEKQRDAALLLLKNMNQK